MSANSIIKRFTLLVKVLPAPIRALWDRATLRQFDLGIQAGENPRSFVLPLRADTIAAAASVQAELAVTVYGEVIHHLKSSAIHLTPD